MDSEEGEVGVVADEVVVIEEDAVDVVVVAAVKEEVFASSATSLDTSPASAPTLAVVADQTINATSARKRAIFPGTVHKAEEMAVSNVVRKATFLGSARRVVAAAVGPASNAAKRGTFLVIAPRAAEAVVAPASSVARRGTFLAIAPREAVVEAASSVESKVTCPENAPPVVVVEVEDVVVALGVVVEDVEVACVAAEEAVQTEIVERLVLTLHLKIRKLASIKKLFCDM